MRPSRVLPLPFVYFDVGNGKYCISDDHGRWIKLRHDDLVRHLATNGYFFLHESAVEQVASLNGKDQTILLGWLAREQGGHQIN